jgi:hypothetical protein
MVHQRAKAMPGEYPADVARSLADIPIDKPRPADQS